jgi:hypothetical protein
MKNITIKDVLYEFTFRWDKRQAIQNIMFPDDNMIGEKCEKVIKAYEELYPIYNTEIELAVDLIENDADESLDDEDRLKIITEIIKLKGLNHNLETIIA